MKTYSHLAGQKRMPSEYEIVTTGLLYYVERGFEVEVPLSAWYRKYQIESPLVMADWDRFRDPRETTYTKYTLLQKEAEAHVGGILRSIDESDYDANLSEDWLMVLERVLSPARYAFHGLQMLAAYVGQMAPSGRITIAAALQAADEMRRVQRFAYRMAQLRLQRPQFGEAGQRIWTQDESWQPVRKVIERLLVTYDWAESFTALNLCAKPVFDELWLVELGEIARARGDYLFRELCFSLNTDCKWQRDWSAALVRLALEANGDNLGLFARWVGHWAPLCDAAAAALASAFGPDGAVAAERARKKAHDFRAEIGLGA
ncbi:MAG TPA: hypothetical protein VGP93_07055 [Polyangiaceae bacterium]|nr:hypothetical protein [Polyangiaceae bacterium]